MTTPPNKSTQPSRSGTSSAARLTSFGSAWLISGRRPPRHSMCTHHIATASIIGLLAVLAVGCSGMTADEEADWRKSFGIAADMPMKDLGEVELRAGIPKRVSIGGGKDCTITATVLTNGLVQLNLLYKSKGEVIDDVKTQSQSERQLVFRPSMVPARWRLALPPIGPHFVVAMRPIIIP